MNSPSRFVASTARALAHRRAIAPDRPARTPSTSAPPPRPRAVGNYRSYPERFGPRLEPLTPAEYVSACAVLIATALYGVACFCPSVVGSDRPVPFTLRQLLFGHRGDWCWVVNPLLLAACLYLLDCRYRVAFLWAAAATGVGLGVHLHCAGWRAEALGVGYALWQAAVLVVGAGAVLAGCLSGLRDRPSDHVNGR